MMVAKTERMLIKAKPLVQASRSRTMKSCWAAEVSILVRKTGEVQAYVAEEENDEQADVKDEELPSLLDVIGVEGNGDSKDTAREDVSAGGNERPSSSDIEEGGGVGKDGGLVRRDSQRCFDGRDSEEKRYTPISED
jgi:hypothetical protein